MSVRYVLRPQADRDLEDEAFYLAETASPEVGHRFLIAAHETFPLLASQPEMGWHPGLKHPDLALLRVFRITGFERMLVLYLARNKEIEIVRIVHGSRDLNALLLGQGV